MGGAELECGRIETDAPDSTKNLCHFANLEGKLSFLQVRKTWLWLILVQKMRGGSRFE
jgi:hypothetical protein